MDWRARDREKAQKLEEACKDLYAPEQKPYWQRQTPLLKRVGLLRNYTDFPSRFPQIKRVLAKYVETREEFIARRLDWTVRQFASEGIPLSLDKLRRTAALRVGVVKKHESMILDLAAKYDVALDGFFANAASESQGE